MKSLYVKIVISILIVGLLAACGSQATDTPASPPTQEAAATEAATETLVATEVPTEVATESPTEPAATEVATEPAAATQPAAAGATVSFANDIFPILESRCIGCHGGERTQEGLDLKTHANLMAGSSNGFVVTPGDAANSLLVELVTNQKMPKRGPKLTPPQVQLITEWVNQGAQDN